MGFVVGFGFIGGCWKLKCQCIFCVAVGRLDLGRKDPKEFVTDLVTVWV